MMGGCLCDYGPTGVERGTQAFELTQACQNRISIAAIVLSPTFNHLFQCFAPLRFGILTAYSDRRRRDVTFASVPSAAKETTCPSLCEISAKLPSAFLPLALLGIISAQV